MRIQVVASVDGGFLTKWILSGLGSHLACLSDTQRLQVLKWSQLTQTVDVVGVGLVKVSVCLCVLRVLERATKKLARCIWILIAFIVAIHLTQLVLFLTQCRPLDAIWMPQIHGQCFSLHVTYLAGYIRFGERLRRTSRTPADSGPGFDALTDLLCAGIPIFVIQRLQMNIRTKIALCFLMGLGVL